MKPELIPDEQIRRFLNKLAFIVPFLVPHSFTCGLRTSLCVEHTLEYIEHHCSSVAATQGALNLLKVINGAACST